ncbi:(2Fe-2S)-binding protein [Austwickia chelonae]|uniref:(2Fe-2S)-binding protein n=1 Tax=Austwickia chelonae TaxID=100225 RepID=UPI000E250810|nr:(2Fe-2S)-binding protein [Austwickia chelonae]
MSVADTPCPAVRPEAPGTLPEETLHVLAEAPLLWSADTERTGPDECWRPATTLTDPSWWAAAAPAYAQGLDSPRTRAGAACALQHYTGRLAGVVLIAWAHSGLLLDLDHRSWWFRTDTRYATTAVCAPDRATLGTAEITGVTTALIDHCTPLVHASEEGNRLPRRLGWGSLAASCAAAFALIHRSVDTAARPSVATRAQESLAAIARLTGRPLVTVGADTPAGPLHQRRHTCCLVHTGRGHGHCGSCPRLSDEEWLHRQQDPPTTTIPGLTWADRLYT